MTISPPSTREHFDDLDAALGALRRRGLRVSAVRRLILQALFAARAPLSAESIVRAVDDAHGALDAASVYRNLETFEQAGIVRHVHLGHGAGQYALVGAGELEHLHCERCGATHSVDVAELDDVRALVHERFGFSARFTHFPIVGLCADCLQAAARLRR